MALRPHQWIKNLLIFAAPIASVSTFDVLLQVALGFIGFCLVSSAGYLINDWKDRENDKLHLLKQARPFAKGVLTRVDFFLMCTTCVIFAVIIAHHLSFEFLLCLALYFSNSIFYTFKLKNIPVLEIAVIANGFLLRALAGSVIIRLQPTGWFLVVVYFGSIFMITNKRIAEISNNYRLKTRNVLSYYSSEFLEFLSTMSAAITILTYALWVFENHPNSLLAKCTIMFFSICIFIYKWIITNSMIEAPEHAIFQNYAFLILAGITVIFLVLVFYL